MSNYLTDHRIIAVSRFDNRVFSLLQGGYVPIFKVPSSVSYIQPHALDGIDGLSKLVLQNPTKVVIVASEVPQNVVFSVPSNMVSAYQEAYPNRIIEAMTLTPDYDTNLPIFLSTNGEYQLAADIATQVADGEYSLSSSYVRETASGEYAIIQ